MNLTEKQLEKITTTAVQAALEFLETERKKQIQDKKDRRLRNIKLLLRNYRALVKHCEDIKHEISVLNEKLDLDELDTDEFAIEAIKRSKERTLVMVRFMDKMINVYGKMCEEMGEREIKQFEILQDLYIKEPRRTKKEIATVHFVSVKTVDRSIEKTVEGLSVLMFGVDALGMGTI